VTGRANAPWWTTARPPAWAADLLLAVAVALFQAGVTAAITHEDGADVPPLATVLLAVSGLALAGRRRWPIPVFAVVFAATFGYLLAGFHMGPIWLALIIAFLTVMVRGHRRVGAAFLVVGYAIAVADDPSWVSAAGLAAWLVALVAVAEVVRGRRAHADEERRRRQSDERLRIARDLHDVLAHNISLINVRASVGLHLLDRQPDEARAALAAIKDASSEALGELRWVLESLRAPEDAPERASAPRLAELESLVAQARSAGLDVALEVSGDRRPLSAGVELAAYRIVQEALTNVLRHAGPARARIRLVYGAQDLVVEVDDDGAGTAPASALGAGAGAGLVGMRERAAALGGEVDAGPRDDAPGFRVRARLPAGSAA
jgi:signal transduction histidine kinase